MKINFKVYPRKIDVYFLTSTKSENTLSIDRSGALFWQYLHSSNAYRTCRDAANAAKVENPLREYRANFSK